MNSLNHKTAQPPHHSFPTTIKSPNRIKEKRRYELPNKKPKTNIPNKPKQQKITGFGFKRAKKFMTTKKISSPLTKLLSKPPLTFYRNSRETNSSEIN